MFSVTNWAQGTDCQNIGYGYKDNFKEAGEAGPKAGPDISKVGQW